MARTMAAERLGIVPEVIEAQLAHAMQDALGRADNRTQFLEQRRELMTKWADYLDRLRVGVQVIPSVRLAVEYDERAKDVLRRSGVALYSPEWRDDHATGLDVLHMTVDHHLGDIRRSAGLEASRGDVAPATNTLEGSGNAH